MLTIITVCHNSSSILGRYVQSFLDHNTAGDIEFVWVENSNDNNTRHHADQLEANGFKCKLIFTKNHGFGAGCNRGFSEASGDVVIFANPDIEFKTSVKNIKDFFLKNFWGTVLQKTNDGRCCSFGLYPEYQNVFTDAFRAQQHLHRFRRIFPNRIFPIGSFLVISAEAFRLSGGFNEEFFLYFEETELSRRMQALYGPPSWLPEVEILHKVMATQPDRDFTFEQEAKGLATYCHLTGQRDLMNRRLRDLKLLSPLSRTASRRARFYKKHIEALNQ